MVSTDVSRWNLKVSFEYFLAFFPWAILPFSAP